MIAGASLCRWLYAQTVLLESIFKLVKNQLANYFIMIESYQKSVENILFEVERVYILNRVNWLSSSHLE